MSQPRRKDFRSFSESLGQLTTPWEPIDATEVDKRAMTPYATMAELVIERADETSGDLHKKLISPSAKHGTRVIGRYCNIAALVARRDGLGKEELVTMLSVDSSFGPLSRMASLQDAVSYRVEVDLGIGTHILHERDLAPYVEMYQVGKDGGLAIPKFDEVVINKVADVALEGRLEEGKICPAHANRELQPIYHKFIKICASDPLLFDCTLSTNYASPVSV